MTKITRSITDSDTDYFVYISFEGIFHSWDQYQQEAPSSTLDVIRALANGDSNGAAKKNVTDG